MSRQLVTSLLNMLAMTEAEIDDAEDPAAIMTSQDKPMSSFSTTRIVVDGDKLETVVDVVEVDVEEATVVEVVEEEVDEAAVEEVVYEAEEATEVVEGAVSGKTVLWPLTPRSVASVSTSKDSVAGSEVLLGASFPAIAKFSSVVVRSSLISSSPLASSGMASVYDTVTHRFT